jgi:hypothetical protein
LEVYYTIENTIPHTDAGSVLTVNGVERTITVRSLGIGTAYTMPTNGGSTSIYNWPTSSPLLQHAWSTGDTSGGFATISGVSTQSTLNAVTSTTVPSLAVRTSASTILSQEITGVGWRKKIRFFWNTSVANQTNNLFIVGCNSLYQILVQPGIVKTNLDTMTLDVTFEVYIV